eukprot:TRINITY_DN68046_c0_g1_i1.p1 TRINITY_DN68046_c0_g1~~TRINITY_DN68046_c0_g1_i1.p1  ORF type:complete len:449 (+),score=87.44 TRINITY_DN68046_c0_g1_i1:71-1417(+)
MAVSSAGAASSAAFVLASRHDAAASRAAPLASLGGQKAQPYLVQASETRENDIPGGSTASTVAGLAIASVAAASAGKARRQRARRATKGRKAVAGDGSVVSEQNDATELGRRALLVGGGVTGTVLAVDTGLRAADERYTSAGTILAPAPYKTTLRTELVPGKIWGFEQCIALASVSANIRMSVVKLNDGTLWVSAPISPSRECLRQLDELGKVAHLVVPTTALEHKASMGEFAKIFPDATVWVAPGQGGSPISVPSKSIVLGEGVNPPWADELPFKVFAVGPPITDPFSEVAFFHKESETLLVTDCALKLGKAPPKVLESYGYDGTPGPISPDQWQYKAIAFNFLTARGKQEADFAALERAPALVNPLIRYLVYRRCPEQVSAWVEDVAKWPFKRIVPCHLDAPFDCTPQQFLDAFGFLKGKPSSFDPEDDQLEFLRGLRDIVGGPTF